MDAEFDKVYEKFTSQVRILQQVRADALNCSNNLVRLCQSLAALTKSVGGDILHGMDEDDDLQGQIASSAVAEQEKILNVECAAADSKFKSSVLSPLEDELLRARDALFRMEIRKRLHQEIESLRPRMSNPQVQQYVRERHTEYEASTRGLLDTMTTLLPRQKSLTPILLNEIVEFQLKFYKDATARLRKVSQRQEPAPADAPDVTQEPTPSATSADQFTETDFDDPVVRWSVETAAVSQEGLATGIIAKEQSAFVVKEKSTPSSSVSGSTHGGEALSAERQNREQLRAQQDQEIKKRAGEKLNEVRERQQKLEQEMDDVSMAKELAKPRIDSWTDNEQLRGNLVALLIGLDGLFPSDWNWKPVTGDELTKASRVKLYYNKAVRN